MNTNILKKITNCPICLTELANDQKFKFIESFNLENESFSLYECPICEVQFWEPFKNPGSEWYEKNSFNVQRKRVSDETYLRWAAKYYWHTGQFLKNPPHNNPKGKKLLDIACSTGGFILEAKKIGYDVYGVDFDSEEIKIAKSFGLDNVYTKDAVKFLTNYKNEFDVITGFEIIEHLDQPKRFLKLINEALKEDGYLILSTPNRKRYFGRIHEFWDFPYHHLMRFSKKSLKKLVEQLNFIDVRIKEQNSMDFFVNASRIGLGKFLRKKINKNSDEIPPGLFKDRVFKIGLVKDAFVKILVSPFVVLLYWLGLRGPDMYLVAKKK